MFFINSEFFQLCLTFRYFGWLDFSILKVSWQLWDKKLPEVTKAGLWTVWFVKIWWQDLLKRIFMTLHQREYTFMVCIFPIIKFVKKWNYTFCRIQKQQAHILEGEVFSVSWSISKVFFLLTGLFLEGASLDRKTGKLVESRPKVLYEQMPVIYIYAINTTAGKDSKLYECPIYRKPARTDLNYIGSIDFESDIGPRHWTMRGVALLCDIK